MIMFSKAVKYGSYLVPVLGTYNFYKAGRFAWSGASLAGDLALTYSAFQYLTSDEIDTLSIDGGFFINSFLNAEGMNHPTFFYMDTVFSRADDMQYFHYDYHY